MKMLTKLIPVLAVLICLVVIARPMMPKHDAGAYDLDTLARLPVSAGGRTKPLDTVARNSLMIVSDRQTAAIGDERFSAIHWLIDVMARPHEAGAYVVFRVDHHEVKDLIGATDTDEKRFSFDQIFEHRVALSEQSSLIEGVDRKAMTVYQRHLSELFSHVNMYMALRDWQAPYALPPIAEGEQWRPLVADLHAQHAGHDDHAEPSEAARRLGNVLMAYQSQDPQRFNQEVNDYAQFLDQAMPEVTRKARFEVFFNQLQPFYQGTVLYVLAFLLICGSLLTAGMQGGALSASLARATMAVLAIGFVLHTFGLTARVYMQNYAPVTNLYSSAVFIGWFCVAMGFFLEWLFRNRLSAALTSFIGFVTLIIAHNLADGDTMQMMQAVLDSNFWLSTHVITVTIGYAATFLAGFIGLLIILLGTHSQCRSEGRSDVLSTMFASGVVSLVTLAAVNALVAGGLNERIVSTLGEDVWFVIHGFILLVGYTSLLMTIFLALALLLARFPWNPATQETHKTLGKMMYGVIAFALLFSFVGTVLGGIWADQSWGRFWGWDPKENGAVLIVLMNALILHARWGGMVKTRGVAVLAVFGNIITAWSWFGTNMLGVGLHSYGFMDSAVVWMFAFVISQLAVMAAGMVKASRWRGVSG